jgi:DNA-directed RNA polymerase subunit RPC12/RpoP
METIWTNWQMVILRALILVLIGTGTTVATSWLFATYSPAGQNVLDADPDDVVHLLKQYGGNPNDPEEYYGSCVYGCGLSFETAVLESEPTLIVIVTRAGWPFHALWGSVYVWDYQDPSSMDSVNIRSAIELSPSLRSRSRDMPNIPYVLPLRPMWAGLAVNSMIYGVLWCGMLAGISRVRQWRRRREARCTLCGYIIAPGTGYVCSECGGALQGRR